MREQDSHSESHDHRKGRRKSGISAGISHEEIMRLSLRLSSSSVPSEDNRRATPHHIGDSYLDELRRMGAKQNAASSARERIERSNKIQT